ncbi:ski oncogene, putative [Ixodes scapularis]|uniref:Ski oncogene, putative n=1 Tax=Ixodes scapularis TaxID=6945 RepID=B7QAZ7_IXOSC|nr:ski oncogene, putative [Ixodes scapularis]|eukprot:XP_002412723.1 ski oncogene, putative [Ixodes scapularis]
MEPPSTSAPQRSPPPPVQAVAGGGSTGCTPHLKRVLKSYQAAAVSSLQGPPGCLMAAAGGSPGSGDDEELPAPAPFPIQQPPLLTPPDQSRCSERSETQLESYSISCFSVGGERRLCLPQILSTVLAEFSQPQINGVCDELHIFCSRCNAEQLDVLKATGVIPSSAPSCGLITKSDAERLCAALIHQGAPPQGSSGGPDPVPVYHECFGGGTAADVLAQFKAKFADDVAKREQVSTPLKTRAILFSRRHTAIATRRYRPRRQREAALRRRSCSHHVVFVLTPSPAEPFYFFARLLCFRAPSACFPHACTRRRF